MAEKGSGRRRGRTPRGEKKVYRPGDTLHVLITQDFAEVANEFFEFCRRNNYNASDVIRSCIRKWLEERKKEEEARVSYDERLLKLLEEAREEGGVKKEKKKSGGIKIYKVGGGEG
ncbi:MAG: hypothetical protein J7L88_01320 [Thermoplasmata archaeon]|nr:hypothetical protein [Thermoplasmata archaeon]